MGAGEPGRSAALPVALVVGGLLLLLLAGLLEVLECPTCSGRGEFAIWGLGNKQASGPCPRCEGAGRVSTYRRWLYSPPPEYAR